MNMNTTVTYKFIYCTNKEKNTNTGSYFLKMYSVQQCKRIIHTEKNFLIHSPRKSKVSANILIMKHLKCYCSCRLQLFHYVHAAEQREGGRVSASLWGHGRKLRGVHTWVHVHSIFVCADIGLHIL
jgi:hypothetical protein